MNKKIIGGIASVIFLSVIFLSVQSTDGEPKIELIVLNDENIEILRLEPYRLLSNHWTYIVNVCATINNLDISEVILKSDIDEQVLGVNKTIEKGNCSSFGSIMKGIDKESFSAELVKER
ncbi:MAG: hypothetical protein OES14_05835 [Nitrosopumilus sp.]|nr:hypothetical protein [Nitrosopumilus sp.]MDH3825296.1 hypothetical protein [Nitrosopumilus sp.]